MKEVEGEGKELLEDEEEDEEAVEAKEETAGVDDEGEGKDEEDDTVLEGENDRAFDEFCPCSVG